MSSITKLSIQGIRSFTCEKAESISFGTPLTLICGANGSGKTTVIECLKYATTGFLPPNSKGGAFINDPNITLRNAVTAQIKLYFKSVSGEHYVITRTMQLVKKGSKYTFKTLENQLEKNLRGERTSVSGKSSDIDNELPNYLGITKPILDYVIFCHQDESLWPLSEPSQLKKKFDDIFQASKFTRILDNLKVINKDLSVDIKLLEKSVEHLKIDRKRSRKIVDNLNGLKLQIDELNTEIGDLSIKIEENETKLENLFNSNQEFQLILSKYDQLTFNKSTLIQQFNRLRDSIELLPDTTEVLMEKLTKFNQVLQQYTEEIDKITNENNALKLKVNDNQKQLNELNKLQGSLGFKETQYKQNLDKLNTITDGSDKSKFQSDLKAKLESTNLQLIDIKMANQQKRQKGFERLQSISEVISNQNHLNKLKQDSISELQSRIDDLNALINSSTLTEDSLDEAKQELGKLMNKYEETKKSDFLKELDIGIKKDQNKLVELENEFDRLNREIQVFNNQSDLMNKINNTKDVIRQQENSKNVNLNNINELVPVTEQNFEREFLKVFDKLSKDVDNSKRQLEAHLNTRNSIETTIKINEKSLEDKKKQLISVRNKVLAFLSEDEIDSYDQILKEAEDDYNDSVETLKTFEVSKDFRIKALELSKKTHNCLLCQRGFDDNQLEQFINQLTKEINNMSKEQVDQEYEEAKKDFENLKSISSSVTQLSTLKNEIAYISNEALKDYQKKLSDANNACDESSKNLQVLQTRFTRLSESKYLIEEVKKLQLSLQKNNDKLQSYDFELSDLGIKKAVSLDQLNKLVNDTNIEIKSLRNRINNDKDLKLNKERDLNKLSSSIKDKEIEIKNIESQLVGLKNNKATVAETKASISRLRLEVEEIEAKLVELKKQQETEIEKNRSMTSELESEEAEKENLVKSLGADLAELNRILDLVEEFELSDKPLLEKNNQDIITLTEEENNLNNAIGKNSKLLKDLEKKINESSNLKSIIRDNIDYQNLQREIADLEAQLEQLNIDKAEEQKSKYQTESKKLRDLITNLNSENSFKIGQIRQINEQVKSYQHELTSEYNDVDGKYHKEWVKLQTNLLISNDLITYSKSVDNAIMKYHSIKMEEINKMLKYLWSSTYQGTDIDSIAIKSDMNSQNKGNRSYNYRVVMQKGKVELDMRGRCSAGQRVLTSILIRLTLAECFGSNCGMIALDEPTTNLDEENARSLAESLNRIVELRREQDNFQIIIITHDQKFLSHINADYCENFYKIQRDNNQASEIRTVPIFQLQDE